MKNFLRTVFGAFLGTLLALFVLFLILAGVVGSMATLFGDAVQPKAPQVNTILKISGTITEQKTESFNFTPATTDFNMFSSTSLLSAVRAIDAAAKDPAIKMLFVRPDELVTGLAAAEELRAAMERFRASGKPVIAYADSYSVGTYYVASVADKVIMNTYGDIMFSSLSGTLLFYKDLIDQLGIDIQLIRHGKYKSAGEPFIKNDISPENRAQQEAMLRAIWNTLVDGIDASRDFSAEDFNRWVDNLEIAGPEDALAKGIIDELWYKDEVEDYLCSLCDVEKAKDLKITNISDYSVTSVKNNPRIRNKIAVLYANGQIVMGDNGDGYIGDKFAEEIAKVRKDSTVKAVVFRVNSPGGSVQASAIIEREIELLKKEKPVIASYGEYAASGGYWISCGCDKIFSDNTTLTGSIGVFGLLPSFGRALKKNVHVNPVEISLNKHGALGDGLNPLDEEEVAWMQGMIERTYSDFVTRVSNGRDIPYEKVDELAQGRVWAGSDAIGIGLVDQIGTLQDAIDYAASAAALADYQIAEYPAVKSSFEKLAEMFSGTADALLHIDKPKAVEAVDKDLEWLKQVDGPEVMVRMTAIPEINR